MTERTHIARAADSPRPSRHRSVPELLTWLLGALAVLLLTAEPLLAQQAAGAARAYGDFPGIGSRAAIWIAAEVHLMFAAFVLGVPMFAVIVEAWGIFARAERGSSRATRKPETNAGDGPNAARRGEIRTRFVVDTPAGGLYTRPPESFQFRWCRLT